MGITTAPQQVTGLSKQGAAEAQGEAPGCGGFNLRPDPRLPRQHLPGAQGQGAGALLGEALAPGHDGGAELPPPRAQLTGEHLSTQP